MLIEDSELAVLVMPFFEHLKSIQAFDKLSIKDLFKARTNPESAIRYLEKNMDHMDDFWAALWMRTHRDYPELVKKYDSMKRMPENPFMPTSIEHPLPPFWGVLSSFPDTSPPTGVIIPEPIHDVQK